MNTQRTAYGLLCCAVGVPFPLRVLALPLVLTPLLGACGSSGGGEVLGQVNDTSTRICVIDADNLQKPTRDRIGRCFEASQDQLRTVAVGDCVSFRYETPSSGRAPKISDLTKSDDCPRSSSTP